MTIERIKIFNTDAIGVFAQAAGQFVFAPSNTSLATKRTLESKTLNQVVELGLGGINAVGVMVVSNNNGVLLPYNADDEDVVRVKKLGLSVAKSASKSNALGNLLAANSTIGFASPKLNLSTIKLAEDVLNIEVVKTTVANLMTVGSALVLNNKGFICHPETTEEEFELIRSASKLAGSRVTINSGYPYVRSGILSDDKFALVGYTTTGIEMAEIENALGL